MCHDDWVNNAMADDSLVVHLLLHLRFHQTPPPPFPFQLHWTLRQRRSKSVPNTRASPTTPLSWSAAALDGYDESTRPTKLALTSRSKVANPSETTITKKSRRKKTLAELKEEENLLLKKRRSLKNELAFLRPILEKHRASNETLKRLKLDLESQRNSNIADNSEKTFIDPPCSVEAHCDPFDSIPPEIVTHKVHDGNSPVIPSNSSSKPQEMGNQASSAFVLPDLNLPVEE